MAMENMLLALKLAGKADPFPNPRVGAVLARGNRILGTGHHKAPGMPHAEIEAIENAKSRSGNPRIAKGATLYVTLEPCSHKNKRTPPCTEAIIANGIARVVFAMKDPNPLVSGASELRKAGIRVNGPTNQKQAESINKRYIAHISKKPLVAIKMAMSADGKAATKTGDSKWITSRKARECVYRLRAEFDAVVVGAGTVKTDDPKLTTHGKGRDPYRVIVDGDLCIPPGAKILGSRDGKTIIATSGKAPKNKIKKINGANCGVQVFICGKSWVDMRKLVLGLSAMGMKRILIEGGGELNAKALEAGIVDRVYFFIAPKIIGGRNAKSVIGGDGIEKMADALRLKNMKLKKIGGDFLIQAEV